MLVNNPIKTTPNFTIFIGGMVTRMVTIPSHEWFMALFYPHYYHHMFNHKTCFKAWWLNWGEWFRCWWNGAWNGGSRTQGPWPCGLKPTKWGILGRKKTMILSLDWYCIKKSLENRWGEPVILGIITDSCEFSDPATWVSSQLRWHKKVVYGELMASHDSA